MDENEFVLKFLKQSMLGQRVDMNNSDAVLRQCIKLADRDMLVGGRFVVSYMKMKLQDERVQVVLEIMKNKKQDNLVRFKRSVIDDIANECIWSLDRKPEVNNHYFTSYGLAQKVYTMAFKYMYVFRREIRSDISVDFSKCDCPIDSIILENWGKKRSFLGQS